tara:strand:+ start:4658 stop:5395 length:738 start_codon:yes stop_codon:yes gene_type:complete
MIDIPVICYSHSEYSDVWDIHFGQLNKNLPTSNKYLFTNDVNRDISDDIKVILYDDKLSYSKRVLSCLEQLEDDIVLFQHEDMILYDGVEVNKLNSIIDFLKEYDIDYVKLIKGGHNDDIKLENMPIDNLYYIPHRDLSFAIQPTLWKIDKLKDICKNAEQSSLVGNVAVGNFELSASEYINNSDIKGLYWYSGEKKRGMYHWDSKIYPYGNMIFKGKWVYSEYDEELVRLHKEYNIEKNIRGTI